MAVKSKLQKTRKDIGLTQTDMANAAGISRQAYTSIESGKSVPSTEIALRLARKLKTTVEDLFWLDDNSERIVQAELTDESGVTTEGMRMQLIRVGSAFINPSHESRIIRKPCIKPGRCCCGCNT